MSTRPVKQSNRRDFIKNSSAGLLAAGLGGTLKAEETLAQEAQPDGPKEIDWQYPHKKCEPIGPMDLILQLEEGQKLADESLLKYGTVEPAEGGSGGRTMRDACMPAEGCAVYYAMTGNPRTGEALKSAIRTFHEYRHKARGHRVRYERMEKPLPLDFETYPEKDGKPTIEYEMASIHVGRNMMGMRAAAHVLKDRQLLEDAANELRFWLDTPLGYNKGGHWFYGVLIVDANGKPIRNSRGYNINMSVSLASAMWLIGHDLGDDRMMRYGKEAILKGLPPVQKEDGYFPYAPGSGYGNDNYHGLTCQKLSLLLAYDQWRQNEVFMGVFRRAVAYMRERVYDNGMVKSHNPAKFNWDQASDIVLISARMRRYLGEEEAMPYVHKSLRWLHWNSPSCVPFWPNDEHVGMRHLRTANSYISPFRRATLTAWEGIHLKQKGIRDVEAVFVG